MTHKTRPHSCIFVLYFLACCGSFANSVLTLSKTMIEYARAPTITQAKTVSLNSKLPEPARNVSNKSTSKNPGSTSSGSRYVWVIHKLSMPSVVSAKCKADFTGLLRNNCCNAKSSAGPNFEGHGPWSSVSCRDTLRCLDTDYPLSLLLFLFVSLSLSLILFSPLVISYSLCPFSLSISFSHL